MKSIGEILLIDAMIKTFILLFLILFTYYIYAIIKIKVNKKIKYKKSLLKKQAIAEINRCRLKEEHKKMFLVIKDF